MAQPTFERHQLIIFGQNSFGSHGNFGGGGNKGISNIKRPWGQSHDAKADFKRHAESTTFDKHLKWERSISDKNDDSWNKAKRRQ